MILSWSVTSAGAADFAVEVLEVVFDAAGFEVVGLEAGVVDCARTTTGAKNNKKRILFRLASRPSTPRAGVGSA